MKTPFEKPAIIKYRRERAYETLENTKKLIDLNMLSFAMNRIYYAGLYIVNALMIVDSKKFTKHKQVIGYFNKEYLKTNLINREIGKILNDSFERRTAVDYHDYTTVTKSEVNEYLTEMKKFVTEVDKLIEEKLKESNQH